MLVMAVVIYLTNRRQSAAAAKNRPGNPAPGAPPLDQDENARRAREEVRRRIAARRAEAGARPVIAPDPAYRPKGPPPTSVPPLEPEPSAFETEEDRKVLAAQQKLEDQIQALEKESKAVNQTARSAPLTVLSLEPMAAPVVQLSELRDARDLRRAVIWREILDKPVGLR